MGGLEDALAHAQGKITLRSSVLPAPAPTMKPEEIRAVRRGLKVCQAVFGRLLNVPAVTILKWEHGKRKPSGAALRLLEIAKRSPNALISATRRDSRPKNQRQSSNRLIWVFRCGRSDVT